MSLIPMLTVNLSKTYSPQFSNLRDIFRSQFSSAAKGKPSKFKNAKLLTKLQELFNKNSFL
jgi:hypothetical protein